MSAWFPSGITKLGRRRLPEGLVAILDDRVALGAAIVQLHEYANQDRTPGRPRRGIIYRVVEAWESQATRHKLYELCGNKKAPAHEAVFTFPCGHYHLIDDCGVSHACNRHAIAEAAHPHLVLTVEDFVRIPEIVDPRHIVEFSITRGVPRIIYEREYDGRVLVVVEELQARAGLVVKTAYRRK